MKKILMGILVISLVSSQFTNAVYAKGKTETSRGKSVKVDKDSNGIPDEWQQKYHLGFGKNIATKDTDKDGLNNLLEYKLGLSPLSKDTDKDKVPDGNEDNDSDSLTNLQELKLKLDPLSADTDRDGIKDSEEDNDQDALTTKQELIVGTNPLVSDSDKDKILDGSEDKDRDGLTNEVEFSLGYNPLDSDSDNDKVIDGKEDKDKDGIVNGQDVSDLKIKVINENDKLFLLQYKVHKTKTQVKVQDKIKTDYENISLLLTDLALTPSITNEQLVANVKSALGIENYSELQVQVKFGNGKKIKVELKNETQDPIEDKNSETEND
jgi:hypothetical protein